MDIGLLINDVPIYPGAVFDNELFQRAKIRRASLFTRWLIASPTGTKVFWAKNCKFSFFNGGFEAFPVLDVEPKDADFVCGTSAFLFLKDGEIQGIVCQIIGSKIQALGLATIFIEMASEKIGSPSYEFSNISIWENTRETFSCELSESRKNSYFQWMLRESV